MNRRGEICEPVARNSDSEGFCKSLYCCTCGLRRDLAALEGRKLLRWKRAGQGRELRASPAIQAVGRLYREMLRLVDLLEDARAVKPPGPGGEKEG